MVIDFNFKTKNKKYRVGSGIFDQVVETAANIKDTIQTIRAPTEISDFKDIDFIEKSKNREVLLTNEDLKPKNKSGGGFIRVKK